jgi:Zn-dependent protease
MNTKFGAIWSGLDWSVLLNIIESIIPALVCIIIHEICHGLMALALGDKTAKSQGRLSLNPLRHIDIFGLIMLAIAHIGWAKPVSIDMSNFKKPKRDMALTALAGPVSNFLLAAVILFVFGLVYPSLEGGSAGDEALNLLYLTAYLSVSLGIFNLIPFPPLDGSKVLFSLLPDRVYMKLMYFERYGMIILIIIVFGLSRLGINPISAVSEAVFNVFFNIAAWSFKLVAG